MNLYFQVENQLKGAGNMFTISLLQHIYFI